MSGLTVIIHCEASARVGLGHLMRCFALAEYVKAQDALVTFVMRKDAAAEQILRRAGWLVIWMPAASPVEQIAERLSDEVRRTTQSDPGPVWVVLDTYEELRRQSRATVEAGAFLLLIVDDPGSFSGPAAALLNPNPEADPSWYPNSNGARLLLGASYALVRQEFSQARSSRRAPREVTNILVTLGGTDANNRTALVLSGLEALPVSKRRQINVNVVLGPASRHSQAVRTMAANVSYRCAIASDVSKMSSLWAQANLAMTGAGGTLYEAAYVGVPTLMMVLSANQQRNAEAFARQQLAVLLGDAAALTPRQIAEVVAHLMDDAEQRTALANRGRAMVDGKGPTRICQAMLDQSRVPQRETMVGR